jgi:hypothetical protein
MSGRSIGVGKDPAADRRPAAVADLGRPVSWDRHLARRPVEGVTLPRKEGSRIRIGRATFDDGAVAPNDAMGGSTV